MDLLVPPASSPSSTSRSRADMAATRACASSAARSASAASRMPAIAEATAGSSASASQGASSQSTAPRSEEHTSELQSRQYLVCRLLLEKKNKLILTSLYLRNLDPSFADDIFLPVPLIITYYYYNPLIHLH